MMDMQPATYKVSTVSGQPVFDSLPVAKITDYPLEKRDYKPFAQCILCIGEDSLHLRMWAFEVSPMPSSALCCVVYCFEDSRALEIKFTHGENHDITTDINIINGGTAQPVSIESIQQHPHNGEDLQGVYWGQTVSLPLAAIGDIKLQAGKTCPGNFYKTCDVEPFIHKGSFSPADFEGDPYSLSSMGIFEAVSY